MARKRRNGLKSLALGLLAAILLTLSGMITLAAALMYLRFSDSTLTLINQLIKLLAVALGTMAAVPRGGEKGLATGAALALFYISIGYALYLGLGGGSFSAAGMLGEMLLGVAVGAVTGVVRANMGAGKR